MGAGVGSSSGQGQGFFLGAGTGGGFATVECDGDSAVEMGRALTTDFLVAQFYIHRAKFFSTLAPKCLDASRAHGCTASLISALVKVLTRESDEDIRGLWQVPVANSMREALLDLFFRLSSSFAKASGTASWDQMNPAGAEGGGPAG